MRHKRNPRRYAAGFSRRFLEAIGAQAAGAGVIAVFAPDMLKNQWWLIALAVVVAATWAVFKQRQTSPSQWYAHGNFTIRLVVGDLFQQDASAMVGMTTTFDTDPTIIDASSVQGSFLRTVYASSHTRLDQELEESLAATKPVSRIVKAGKPHAYPLGTTAILEGRGAIRYYCLAYTEMDAHNRAQGSIRGIVHSLDKLWDAVDMHSNGAPICVPLLGQGQSRIPELTPEAAVRLMAFSFFLRCRRNRVSSELRIVIHPKEINKIDQTEFQAFLRSLATE
ncbi:macro domain-containing protein [Cryobacterium sp. TMT2-23]|uniref:macro domain-containing protein n=1 Tax=Cryobacterium sp. TMT2-23 TaxID=1259252 RepID=UPI00106B5EC8|nr:macro domain-containing protein [Cryobacterium sp. TMT2-23]TFD20829.1 hypothetical protein E3T32_07840 [Cryobacterium sp. TMT2-23]